MKLAVGPEKVVWYLWLLCCQGQKLGEFGREKFPGEFMDAWRSAVSDAHLEKVCSSVHVLHSLHGMQQAP